MLMAVVGWAAALRGVSPFERLVPRPLANAPYPESDDDDPRVPKKVTLMERYVVQPLDHTDPQDQRTWYQVSFALIAFLLHHFSVSRDKFAGYTQKIACEGTRS